MANFSINQVRHLYVVNAVKSGTNLLDTDEVGSILPKCDGKHLYFQYKSPAGIIRSDLIPVNNILYTKKTSAEKLAYRLKAVKVTLDGNVSASPVAGQEYILRIAFRQYIGLGDEDQNFKYGYVKATPNMDTSDFYKEMAISLAKNVAKDTTPLLTIYLNDTIVTAKTDVSTLTDTYDCIKLEEAEQDWNLGTMPQAVIPFKAQPTEITVNGSDYIWGIVDDIEPTHTISDGHNIADLEYFCMGARGDHYRMMGYPNIIKTTYLVDPTKEYDTFDLHYAFTDSNESVQKSEKDITFVGIAGSIIGDLINAINGVLPSTSEQVAGGTEISTPS